MSWTDERIDALKKMWTEGRTASEIAKILGYVTRSAVCGKAHRLKLEPRTPVPRATPGSGKQMRTLDQLRYKHTQTAPNLERRVLGKAIGKVGKSLVRQSLGTLPTEPLPPVEELHIPLKERKSIATLEANDCRWPIGDPRDADFHFCGKHQVSGLPYCEHHARRAYAPPAVAKTNHPERPTWQDTRTGRKGAVFLSGREKMKAY